MVSDLLPFDESHLETSCISSRGRQAHHCAGGAIKSWLSMSMVVSMQVGFSYLGRLKFRDPGSANFWRA